MSQVVTQEQLNEMLRVSPFVSSYQFQLLAVDEQECTLSVPFNRRFERAGGVIAGSVFMTAADVAMWLAIAALMGPEELSVTANMNTTFLKSLRGEPFRCTARVLKVGRRQIYRVAECRDFNGELLTHSTLIYSRLGTNRP
jgi:uncharacterized protein (TIGR00369 family)